MEITTAIRDKAGDFLKPGHFLVDVLFKSKNPHVQKLLVIVDGDQGISIDDCADLSRSLSDWLDAQDNITSPFTLEVSTPGLDQPLKLVRQYRKNTGREVKVHTRGGQVITGTLAEVTDDSVSVAMVARGTKKGQAQTTTLPFAEIEKTFVVVSFK